MENRTIVTPNPVETNESQLPNYAEEHQQNLAQSDNEAPVSFWNKTIPWNVFIIVMLVVMLVMTTLQAQQYKRYRDVLAKEAYVVSVSINLMEDTLMFKYGVLPEDIGFDELRSAWIDNPCHETSMAYYQALQDALDYFEHGTTPGFNSEPLVV